MHQALCQALSHGTLSPTDKAGQNDERNTQNMFFLCSFNDAPITEATSLDFPPSPLFLTQVESPWAAF